MICNEYLLIALDLEQAKIDIELKTVFEIEVESCLKLHLCRLALSLGLLPSIVFSLYFHQILFNVFLAEILRCSHDFDEAYDVLFISILTWEALKTEFFLPIYFLESKIFRGWYHLRRFIHYGNRLLLLLVMAFLNCSNHIILGLLDLLLNFMIVSWRNWSLFLLLIHICTSIHFVFNPI